MQVLDFIYDISVCERNMKIDYKVQFCDVLFVRVKANIMILCNL